MAANHMVQEKHFLVRNFHSFFRKFLKFSSQCDRWQRRAKIRIWVLLDRIVTTPFFFSGR